MVAVYDRSPEELKGFTWNEDNSINIESKKRPLRPLHPQWVLIFQLKEKQPSNLKGRWDPLVTRLETAISEEKTAVTIEGMLLAHKVRKVYYTPIKRQKQFGSLAVA